MDLNYVCDEFGGLVLPNGWVEESIRDLSKRVTVGFVGSMSHLFVDKGVPLLRGQNVLPNSIDLSDVKFISHETHRAWGKSSLDSGDIVMVRVGYPGTSAVISDDFGPANAASLVVIKPDRSKIDSNFLCHVLNSGIGRSQVAAALVGGAQQVINIGTAASIRIPVPKKKEQTVIASVLSDVDSQLSAIDKLVSKKIGINRAFIRQLMSGKFRLPGFSEDWTETWLDRIGSVFGGLVGKTKSDFGTGCARFVPFTNVMSHVVISTDELDSVNVRPSESQNLVLKGDLLFNGSSETPEELALCACMGENVPGLYLNSFCFGFRICDDVEVDGLFLAYFFRSSAGREMVKSIAQGSTRYNLPKRAFLHSRFRIPCFREQTAIAQVLSEMDAEIAALERRREKTRLLKQAMMQELLTGRTRLA